MKRIAFFWVADDAAIPTCLVQSIRATNADQVEVVQLTDHRTPPVEGVDVVSRHDLPPDIMLARLQAYRALEPHPEFTFYCDADSLFLNPLRVEAPEHILLTPRLQDFPINPHFPEHYPEFEGKMISEVMPFLFGALAVRGDNPLFEQLQARCQALPARFHRWYGDQFALALAARAKAFDYGLLDPRVHLHVTKTALTIDELRSLRAQGTQMITFKGPDSGKSTNIPLTLSRLLSLL
jgi:hypothetical protein